MGGKQVEVRHPLVGAGDQPVDALVRRTYPRRTERRAGAPRFAEESQTPRFLIAVYCRHGLISPLAPPETEGWWFDDETIRTLRRIERLRADYGVNLHGLCLVAGLIEELEGLRAEARFLRGR